MKLMAKVTAFFLLLGLVSGGLVIGLTWSAVKSAVTKNLVSSTLNDVAELAENSVDGFLNQSETQLLSMLQLTQQAMGAQYVEALDPRGRVLAHTNVAEKGRAYEDPATLRILKDDKAGVRIVRRNGEAILEAWAPVIKKQAEESGEQFLLGSQGSSQQVRLGAVRMGVSLEEKIQIQNRIVLYVSLIVVTVGSIAIFFALGLMRSILLRARLLSEGTARIAQGVYGTEVPVLGKDELADLAISFNRMSKVLSETTVSKNFMGNILSHMTDPLMVIDKDGRLQLVNQATLDLLGYSAEEIQGQPADVLVRGKSLPLGAARNLELDFTSKAGHKIPVLISCSLLKTATDHVEGIIAIAKDMTERKRLEGIIRQSDKMSAVGQLAAGVAHEINNPLGVILGFAQAVVRRLKPQDPLELPLRSIEKEAVRCRNLVQDLLTFSRTSRVDREPVDINRAVDGAFSLVIAQARMTHVTVVKDLAPQLPRISGNLNQIQQIVINLASNALDAMAESSGEIIIKTEIVNEGPLAWVCLKVIDSGPGIPTHILPRIFEPFFTTKPVGKGTGLGLSLVHEIIQKHSGTLDVQSRPGRTEFNIKFPAQSAMASSPVKKAAA